MPDADVDEAVDALMVRPMARPANAAWRISVAVPIGEKMADALIEKLAPKVRALNIGPAGGMTHGPHAASGPRARRGPN